MHYELTLYSALFKVITMFNLIKFNFKKLFKTSQFYLILGLFILVISIFLAITIKDIKAGYDTVLSGLDFMLSINNVQILLVYGLFTGWYAIDDYTNNTVKIMYGKGYSRFKVYISKIIVLLIIITIYFVITALVSLLLGTIFIGSKYTVKSNFSVIIALQYLGILYYILGMFCFADIVKNIYAVSVFSASMWIIDMIYVTSESFKKLKDKLLPSVIASAYPFIVFTDSTSNQSQIQEAILSGIIHITICIMISYILDKFSEHL